MLGEGKILFYIVIGIAYYFFKTYLKESKREKEKNINRKPVNSTTSEEIFKRLMRTLEGKDKEPENTISKETITQPISKNKKSIYRSVIAENSMAEEPHLTENDRKIDHSYDEVVLTENWIDLNQTDIRKAIIYSEIFTRPQY